MPAALLAATVAVVPATEPETFGRVTAEAQAMGTPVVVSDLGGLAEIVAAPPEVGSPSAPAGACRPATPGPWRQAVYDVLMLGRERAGGHVAAGARPGSRPLFRGADAGRNAGCLYGTDRPLKPGPWRGRRGSNTFGRDTQSRIDFAAQCADFHYGPGTFVTLVSRSARFPNLSAGFDY